MQLTVPAGDALNEPMHELGLRIVTGGQTGVDRGALDAALARGLRIGGWCPADGMAEDGRIDPRYRLCALPGASNRERTRANVRDSDATAILHLGELAGGTESTLRDCLDLARPYLLLDGSVLTPIAAARRLLRWLRYREVAVLNVAGPRASEAPAAYRFSHGVIDALAIASTGIQPARE